MTETATLQSLSDIFAEVDHLPTLPTIAVEILRLSRDATASLEESREILGQINKIK